MKRKIIPVLIGCTLSFSALAAQPTAERYVVSFPEGTHVNYAGAFASAFPNGLPVGIGSGLLFTGKQGDALTFATITDRGPNADSPKEGKNETKIFVTPDFAPLLMTIRVQNGKAEAIDPRPLHDDKGAINGLPLASDVIGSTNEVAFSDTLHRLKGDNRGLDTEGITPDGKGGYWLCDEYGPFLINIDSKGKILAIHGPQAAEGEKAIAGGLPNILKWRQANRGFEGLTRMPDGRIIVAVQSTLDIDAKSKKKALFTRLVSFDPASGKTAMYGYANQIRRDRPLTHEELMHYVPGIFGEDKHTSRSQNYTYIPTITVLESLQREGFQPFFACQTRVRDPGRRGYTKHMLRLRRAGEINGEHVPEIILLNSHDGTSS